MKEETKIINEQDLEAEEIIDKLEKNDNSTSNAEDEKDIPNVDGF